MTQTITLPTSPLSDQQIAVVRLLADGFTNEEISERLYIGVRTVHTYAEQARMKLLARNRVHLVAQAIRHGVIT